MAAIMPDRRRQPIIAGQRRVPRSGTPQAGGGEQPEHGEHPPEGRLAGRVRVIRGEPDHRHGDDAGVQVRHRDPPGDGVLQAHRHRRDDLQDRL